MPHKQEVMGANPISATMAFRRRKCETLQVGISLSKKQMRDTKGIKTKSRSVAVKIAAVCLGFLFWTGGAECCAALSFLHQGFLSADKAQGRGISPVPLLYIVYNGEIPSRAQIGYWGLHILQGL